MIKNSLLLSFLFASGLVFGQSKIIFDKTVHDFGKIEKTNTLYRATFTLTNNLDKAVVINFVNPECGCTTPKYTKDSIFPGQTGKINIEYDPMRGYTGDFQKGIDVVTNYGSFDLKIKGFLYVDKNSNPTQLLVFDHLYKELGTKNIGDVLYDTLKVYNKSEEVQYVQKVISKAGNFEISIEDENVAVDSYTRVFVKLVLDDMSFLGETASTFTILTSDYRNPMTTILYYHNLGEKFPKLTKKYLKNAQKLEYDHTSIDFGIVKPGSLHYDTFVLSNTGKDTLHIRKIKSPCSCLKYEIEAYSLAPGEKTRIFTIFDTIRRPKGDNIKYLQIISNDPRKPALGLKHSYLIL